MTGKIHDSKLKDKKLVEATEWLLLLNNDEVEQSIKNNFKAWLQQDQSHSMYFKEILQVWQLSALIEPDLSDNIEHLIKL